MRLLASWGALGEQRSSIAARSLRDPWSGLRNDRVGLDKTTDRLPQAKVNMTVTAVNLNTPDDLERIVRATVYG